MAGATLQPGSTPLAMEGKDHLGVSLQTPESFRFVGDRGDRAQVAAVEVGSPRLELEEVDAGADVLPDGEAIDFFAVPISATREGVSYEIVFN